MRMVCHEVRIYNNLEEDRCAGRCVARFFGGTWQQSVESDVPDGRRMVCRNE